MPCSKGNAGEFDLNQNNYYSQATDISLLSAYFLS